jgi:hypothetical protein
MVSEFATAACLLASALPHARHSLGLAIRRATRRTMWPLQALWEPPVQLVHDLDPPEAA